MDSSRSREGLTVARMWKRLGAPAVDGRQRDPITMIAHERASIELQDVVFSITVGRGGEVDHRERARAASDSRVRARACGKRV